VFGLDAQVDVHGRATPAVHDGGRAAGEVDGRRCTGGSTELAHERADALRIGQVAHSAARSKLTRRRISAL
jgi:hypothetical protein